MHLVSICLSMHMQQWGTALAPAQGCCLVAGLASRFRSNLRSARGLLWVLCGEVVALRAEDGALCGDVGTLCGDVGALRAEVGALCGEDGAFCGEVVAFCGVMVRRICE